MKPVVALLLSVLVSLIVTSCGRSQPSLATPVSEPTAARQELVFYSWPEDNVGLVTAAFAAETGITVRVEGYGSQEEAIEQMRAGEVFDIVVMDNMYIPQLREEGLLAEIDRRSIPNFKNISLNFRDLAYDPGNRYAIPNSWGTTGLLVRTDLVAQPVTSWSALWEPAYAGKVLLWTSTPRYTLGAVLKSLGFSCNSEDPAELAAARDRLIALKSDAIWLHEEESAAPDVVAGNAWVALGWALDAELARAENDAVAYVLPDEGAVLWGDNFVIPANSPNQRSAEMFLDFLLRPEISAQIIEANYYPMATDAAREHLPADLLANPIIFPTNEQFANAELLLPLSAAGQQRHDAIWEEILAAIGSEE